jgi:outer membrane protein assembly complex protein YaeT
VVGEGGEVIQQDPANLASRAGQPFALDTERNSLRQLFRTGEYADVVAQLEPAAGGVVLDFVVQRNFYINQVHVPGLKQPLTETLATSALRLGFGEVFREADMPAAIERLQQMLRDEGLYQAKVSYTLAPHPEMRQMDITVNVEEGPRARVGGITLTNQTPFPDEELQGRLKFKTSTQITSQRLNNGAENARKWLVGKHHLGARVTLDRGMYDAKTNEVPLHVALFAGPEIEVKVSGANISSGTQRKLFPIYEEGAVDADLLEEGRRNLRNYLQGEGYFDADVTYTSTVNGSASATETAVPIPAATSAAAPAPQLAAANSTQPPATPTSETITYSVERGPRHRRAGIAFQGNQYFGEDLLRSRLQIQPAAFASRGRYSTALLAADTASLDGLYEANGFLQVKVTNEVVDNYLGKKDAIFVRFHIDEGEQTRVGSLTIEGNRALTTDELTNVIGSSEGQPYSDFNVTGDRDNVLAMYYDKGFPEAHFTAITDKAPDPPGEGPRVNLTYQIDEGRQVLVQHIFVTGNENTRMGVIRREVKLSEGQPLSEGATVESQRRLYDLGVFSRVLIAPQNPSGTDTTKTVGVLVEEARRYTIGYGIGFEAQRFGGTGTGPVGNAFEFSPRGTLEFTKLNLTGRADTLSFKVRASTFQGRALVTYTSSNYFGRPNLSLQISGLYDKSRDVLTFTSRRSEGSVQLTQKLSLTTSLQYRYAYRRVLASDLRVASQEIPLFSQPTKASLLGATWLRDRRDNPTEATKGSFYTGNVDIAFRAIGSSANFIRAFVQGSNYKPIGKRLVFATSARLGMEAPFGGSVSADIPLPERFFAGGGTTLRGFGLNQAGPRDAATGFPIGGLGMLMFNEQLQFPMQLPKIGNRIGGAVFYDGGNVFNTFRQITLRASPLAPVFDTVQANRCIANCTNQMGYFSHTVGFELRYHTPVGPVSVDLAYQLNAPNFLVPDGTTLPGGAPGLKLSRLPAFQFSVNLGSPF